jgi:hypothetical protein
MINKIYNRLAKVRPARRPYVEYWRPDGRFPGEEAVREVLGDVVMDAALRQAAEGTVPDLSTATARPPLRLVK